MTEPMMIPLDQIEVGDRLRRVSPDEVALLGESLLANGQMAPIEVRRDGNGFVLVIGAHRVAAAQRIGWTEIQAAVFEGTEAQARLREIDENLCRRELSELDRATFLAERKRVWLELHPETVQGGVRKAGKSGASGNNDKTVALFPAFTAEVAERLGVSARTIERAVRRFTGLAPEAREKLALTPFANRASELDALAKLDRSRQLKIVALLLREKNPARNVAAAIAQLEGKAPVQADPAEQQLTALVRAWQKASIKARRRFLAMVEGDLADLKGAE